MKKLLLIICAAGISGCTVIKQHKLEKAALDSIYRLDAEGAVTDSIYSSKKK